MEDITPTTDEALIGSAFTLIAESGWSNLSIAEAARRAGLDLADMRRRFPCKLAMLMRFGTMVDTAALTGAITEGPIRDRIFDIVMRRIDTLQAHRPGVLVLLRDLPRDPLTSLALGPASLRSMGWMLEGVGVTAQGLQGQLRTQGMLVLWLATVRAWSKDDSEDLSATMAALDKALDRAAQAEATMSEMLGGAGKVAVADEIHNDPDAQS
jgi:AcrR family transcriptional regulator